MPSSVGSERSSASRRSAGSPVSEASRRSSLLSASTTASSARGQPGQGRRVGVKKAAKVKKVSAKKADQVSAGLLNEQASAQWAEDNLRIMGCVQKDREFCLVVLGLTRRREKAMLAEVRFGKNIIRLRDVPHKNNGPVFAGIMRHWKVTEITMKVFNKDKVVQRHILLWLTNTSPNTEVSMRVMLITNYHGLMLKLVCPKKVARLKEVLERGLTSPGVLERLGCFNFLTEASMCSSICYEPTGATALLPVQPFSSRLIREGKWRICFNGTVKTACIKGPGGLNFPAAPLFRGCLSGAVRMSLVSTFADVESALQGDHHDGSVEAARIEGRLRPICLEIVNQVIPEAENGGNGGTRRSENGGQYRDADAEVAEVSDDEEDYEGADAEVAEVSDDDDDADQAYDALFGENGEGADNATASTMAPMEDDLFVESGEDEADEEKVEDEADEEKVESGEDEADEKKAKPGHLRLKRKGKKVATGPQTKACGSLPPLPPGRDVPQPETASAQAAKKKKER